MKNLILAIAVTSTALFSACSDSSENTSTSTEVKSTNDEALYACPMHPEVIGKKGEQCSKCGMDLTEPVKEMND